MAWLAQDMLRPRSPRQLETELTQQRARAERAEADWRGYVMEQCQYAGMVISSEDIPEENLHQLAPEGTPDEIRCLVRGCNQRGAERHHWAPKHLFGEDSENWPKDYLCLEHHLKWHKIVTPEMSEVKS